MCFRLSTCILLTLLLTILACSPTNVQVQVDDPGTGPPVQGQVLSRETAPADPLSDPTSMISLCEAVIAGDESVRSALASHSLVSKMSEGMRSQVPFDPEAFAAAAFAAQNDPRFSWNRLRKNAAYVVPFVDYLRNNQQQLVVKCLEKAGELLLVEADPDRVTINLVCGSPWDAYVLIFDGPELFFDVGWIADDELQRMLPGFRALLAHELWHLLFLAHQEQHWVRDYRKSSDPAVQFLYRMLNEGVGHYYSLSPGLYPDISYSDFPDREQTAFRLLRENYPRYMAEADAELRQTLLWHSHAGVPFWEKWGAVPGAIVVYYLIEEYGRASVRQLIASEPFSIFLSYDAMCKQKTTLPVLPEPLVSDAGRALEMHQSN